MADWDTVQEAAGRAESVINSDKKIRGDFFVSSKGVQPIDIGPHSGSRKILDAVNSGAGISPADQGYILEEVARSANQGSTHRGSSRQVEGGTEISIHPR